MEIGGSKSSQDAGKCPVCQSDLHDRLPDIFWRASKSIFQRSDNHRVCICPAVIYLPHKNSAPDFFKILQKEIFPDREWRFSKGQICFSNLDKHSGNRPPHFHSDPVFVVTLNNSSVQY
jgi:hypothetical protein